VTPYAITLTVGGVGLVTMAIGGLGRGHAGGGHAGHGGHGHLHGHAQARARGTKAASSWLATLTSPRVLFSLLMGFGGTGIALQHVFAGPALAGSAILGALGFERLIVEPLWRMMLRFAAEPAMTLESCIADEVHAVTSFDAAGNGLVAVEMDGQVSQILATLRESDRATGARIRAGDRLRVEDVDTQRNRCTVSLIGA
jgi:translation initiation factor IF-1